MSAELASVGQDSIEQGNRVETDSDSLITVLRKQESIPAAHSDKVITNADR